MEYEIYYTIPSNKPRVNIGDCSYSLSDKKDNGELVGAEYHGQCQGKDPVLDAYYAAQREIGMPGRFAWRGITNELGHYGAVMPPWAARERDWGRHEPRSA